MHTDLNCLFLSQTVHPVVCLNHSHKQLVPPGHRFLLCPNYTTLKKSRHATTDTSIERDSKTELHLPYRDTLVSLSFSRRLIDFFITRENVRMNEELKGLEKAV